MYCDLEFGRDLQPRSPTERMIFGRYLQRFQEISGDFGKDLEFIAIGVRSEVAKGTYAQFPHSLYGHSIFQVTLPNPDRYRQFSGDFVF